MSVATRAFIGSSDCFADFRFWTRSPPVDQNSEEWDEAYYFDCSSFPVQSKYLE